MLAGFSPDTVKKLVEFALKAGKGRHHITRLYMYRYLNDKLAEMDGPEKKCLAISKSKPFAKILGLAKTSVVEANYPEYDIMNLSSFADGSFDFSISDQVFEHIEGDPFAAFKETTRVLRQGGVVCHTTCFINPVHGVPKDFWRFTPDALGLLAKSSGCEVMETGGWGNVEAWALIHAGFRYTKIPEDENNPLYQIAMKNEPSPSYSPCNRGGNT